MLLFLSFKNHFVKNRLLYTLLYISLKGCKVFISAVSRLRLLYNLHYDNHK